MNPDINGGSKPEEKKSLKEKLKEKDGQTDVSTIPCLVKGQKLDDLIKTN